MAVKIKKEKRWDSPESFLDWLEKWDKLPQFVKKVRPAIITFISLIIVVIIWAFVFRFVNVLINKPVAPKDNHMVIFEIERGQSLSSVARKLEENDLIRNRWVFKLMADFTNKSDKLQAGSYYISKSMTNEEIINTFIRGINLSDTVRVTLTEGMTIEEMVDKLQSVGLIKDKEQLLKTLRTGSGYTDIDEIKVLKNKSERKYTMEGYLFPDTYEYYLSASDQQVVNKLLNRFNDIFDSDMRKAAEKLDMTVDEAVIMASIIEKEGKAADFTKISAVLHNRLKKNMPLQADSTIKYITGSTRVIVDAKEAAVNTPYNTYTNKGLPPGAICNPGRNALYAALHPDQKLLEDGYLFFTATDPETGGLQFSKTIEEHNRAVRKYRPLWEDYDKKHS